MTRKEFDTLLKDFVATKKHIEILEKRKSEIQAEVKPYGTVNGFLYNQVVTARKSYRMDYEMLTEKFHDLFETLKFRKILTQSEPIYHQVFPQNKKMSVTGNRIYGPELFIESKKSPSNGIKSN